MVWEGGHVVDDLDGGVGGGIAADTAGEGDGLAGDAALEGAEDQLAGFGGVECVESWVVSALES